MSHEHDDFDRLEAWEQDEFLGRADPLMAPLVAAAEQRLFVLPMFLQMRAAA